jgi:hypothetical protein
MGRAGLFNDLDVCLDQPDFEKTKQTCKARKQEDFFNQF